MLPLLERAHQAHTAKSEIELISVTLGRVFTEASEYIGAVLPRLPKPEEITVEDRPFPARFLMTDFIPITVETVTFEEKHIASVRFGQDVNQELSNGRQKPSVLIECVHHSEKLTGEPYRETYILDQEGRLDQLISDYTRIIDVPPERLLDSMHLVQEAVAAIAKPAHVIPPSA